MAARQRPAALDGWCHGTLIGAVAQVAGPARVPRADGIEAYRESAFLRYLEEALAESYAQLRVDGVEGLPVAIRFPIAQEYVTLSAVLAQGAVGSVVVAGVVHWLHVESAPTP